MGEKRNKAEVGESGVVHSTQCLASRKKLGFLARVPATACCRDLCMRRWLTQASSAKTAATGVSTEREGREWRGGVKIRK